MRFIILFASLILSNYIFNQQHSFERISIEEGLSQSQVYSITQDSIGYLWIGTADGLNQYDGKTLKSFYKEDGLTDNNINDIYVDNNNRIWISTQNGINLLEHGNLKKIYDGNRIIRTLSHKENIIAFSRSGDILLITENSVQAIEHEFGFVIRDVQIIHQTVWIATNKGLYILKLNNFEIEKSDFNIENISSISYSSKSNKLWLSSYSDGVFCLEISNEKIINLSNYRQSNSELISDRIKHIFVDQNDRIWCTANKDGISVIDGNQFTNYRSNIEINFIPELVFQDRERNIWIGTSANGLCRITNENFTFLSTKSGINSNLIVSAIQTKSGDYWFGSYDAGISIYDGKKFKEVSVESGAISNNRVWNLLQDSNQNIWIGTASGLSIFHEPSKKFKHFEILEDYKGIESSKISGIFNYSNTKVWVGTRKGIIVFDNLQIDTTYSFEHEFPYLNPRTFCKVSPDILWIGTSNGIIEYKDGIFSKLNLLEEDYVIYKIILHNQTKWIATDKGLFKIDKQNNINQVLIEKSLNDRPINFIEIEKERYLWVGTNKGVFCIDLSANKIQKYDNSNGLNNIETNLNSSLIDNKGNVWFGTAEGLHKFSRNNSNEISLNQIALHIKDIRLYYQETDWSNYSNGYDSINDLPINLTIPYNKNHLTFDYYSISYSNQNKINYRFFLEGFDDSWSPLINKTSATYSNLPFGEFTFHVEAYYDDQIINKTSFSFQILSPIWLRWWFILIALIFISSIVFYVVKRRRDFILEKQNKEKLEVQTKLIKLEQQSLNASMNRHFIFNALNSIQYYINTQDRKSANKYLSSFAKLIRKNLDSSSNEESLVPLNEELERLTLYLSLEHMRFDDKFEYQIHISDEVDNERILVPPMFLQPYIENSIWHGILPSEEKGKITLDISIVNNSTIFEIFDTGIGIDNSIEAKKGSITSHTSKGVKLTNDRIELLRKITGKEIVVEGPLQVDVNGKTLGTRVKILFKN